jgi:hypothetical protein
MNDYTNTEFGKRPPLALSRNSVLNSSQLSVRSNGSVTSTQRKLKIRVSKDIKDKIKLKMNKEKRNLN